MSTEFWVVFQISVLLFLVLFFWYFLKNYGRPEENKTLHKQPAEQIMSLLEPLLEEAETSARIFESQILEKKRLIHNLNEKLDNRIISLTLLLNRADATIAKTPEGHGNLDLADTQEAILTLYNEGRHVSDISRDLSVSEQEVDLVVGLKKKFQAMEKNTLIQSVE